MCISEGNIFSFNATALRGRKFSLKMKLHAASPTTLKLMTLVENGDVDEALRILDSNDDTHNGDFLEPWGSLQVTLIQLAAWRGCLQILKHLDLSSTDLNATDKLGRCALHLAAQQGHVDVVKWLLNHGAAVENRFEVSFLPKDKPYNAVSTAEPDCGIGQNLPLPESWGRTALHQAVKARHVEIVKLLVDAGANVDARDERGVTPLHLAAINVNPDDPKEISRFEKVIDILVSASASVNVAHPDSGTTALHHAVTLGNFEATKRLLRAGAWPAARCTGAGITPLHIAASLGFHEILRSLIAGLDSSQINVQDKVGRSPLHAAAYRGHLECLRTLTDHGGNLALETKTGITVIDAIFEFIPRPISFITDILDSRIHASDKTVSQVCLEFEVLAPRGELQMTVVSALIGAIPSMEQLTILQHPLIEAFLELKWARLRRFFFILLIVHVFFIFFLSAYAIILLKDIPNYSLPRRLLCLCACILLTHNLLQLLIVPRHYTRQFETWLSAICSTISIAVAIAGEAVPAGSNQKQTPQWILQSISVAILFAWIQMMLLVGRFPTWGYYALMFSTVLKNVLKLLLAFIWLIVGFALSFSVLFHGNNQFSDSWKAIVKTVVMIMGEFDYDSLFENIDSKTDAHFLRSIISRIIFIIFVMLASIVLMNLMVGLAVSDIQGILKEGHIRRLLKQAEFVAHLEWVTSHRIFKSRLVPRYLRRMLESRKTIPTHVTLRMLAGYGKKIHGISEDLVNVLFDLASKNQKLKKELQKDSARNPQENNFAKTVLSLHEGIREFQRESFRNQRMQSFKRKIARRRVSALQ